MKKTFLSKTSKLLLGSIVFVSIFSFYGCNVLKAKNNTVAFKVEPIPEQTSCEIPLSEDYYQTSCNYIEPPNQTIYKNPCGDGYSPIEVEFEPIQNPTDTQEPCPAPNTRVPIGETIIAKAIAKTTSYMISNENINGVYVNVELTWQPVNEAYEYWIFKGNLPTKEQANKEHAYKIIKADGVLSTYFLDGAFPPSFSGGNLWDKVKKGFKAYTLKVDTEYKYKVFAVDKDKKVLSESENISTTTLPAISAPINISISETNTIQPLFKWENSDGLTPDGYFVSVMPPINFGKEKITNTSYAFWTTYRDEKTKLARYGEKLDESVAYKGTVPFDLITPLKIGGRYSINVTSVKTNTKDMRTATAISKAWSESKLFSLGTTTSATSTPTSTPSPYPSTSEAQKESLLEN